jgi:hypothetical protein
LASACVSSRKEVAKRAASTPSNSLSSTGAPHSDSTKNGNASGNKTLILDSDEDNDSEDEVVEPEKKKARKDDGQRKRKQNKADKIVAVLEEMRDKKSNMQLAITLFDEICKASPDKFIPQDKLRIKKLFQTDSTAELFLNLSSEERELFLKDE